MRTSPCASGFNSDVSSAPKLAGRFFRKNTPCEIFLRHFPHRRELSHLEIWDLPWGPTKGAFNTCRVSYLLQKETELSLKVSNLTRFLYVFRFLQSCCMDQFGTMRANMWNDDMVSSWIRNACYHGNHRSSQIIANASPLLQLLTILETSIM